MQAISGYCNTHEKCGLPIIHQRNVHPMSEASSAPHVSSPAVTLQEIFAAYESQLLIYAQQLTHQPETAQDIVQQAFLILHSKWAEVRHHKAWLYRTVHNLAMNHLRSQRKIVSMQVGPQHAEGATHAPLEPIDPEPIPPQQLEQIEAIGLIHSFLAKLSARERELIRLKFTDELSYKEMASATGLSVSNVGYILHHALRTLALAMQKREDKK